MVKRTVRNRNLKYDLKNDPVVIALRYKRIQQFFKPEMIQTQTTLDNLDKNIVQILDDLNLAVLNRNNYRLVAQQLITLAKKYSQQTLLNSYNELLVKYNLDPDKAKTMFNQIITMMVNEGLIDGLTPVYEFP